uniref:Uncharacterized protein n=1 Tax=Fagus sylvatica TaxID=28930 RepID=A0A2N9IDL4_FAGSY
MEGENAFVLVNNPPPHSSGTRRVMSEVHVEANRERAEGQRGRSHATRDMIDAEALRKSRKIERLERELRELKEVQASCDQQRSRRQRSRSHSGSCESSHRCPKRSEEDRRASKNSRRSRISHSPFSSRIERAKLPARIAPLNLITYNGKTDPAAHLSHYRRSMALYNGDDILMCRIFPSSLGDVALRWFDRLEHGSIHSWTELSEAFTTRFITNTRKPKEVDSLMALAMREDVAISQFRFGLPVGSKLRQSLAKKPPPDMSNLMSRIEQHVRVEEDGLQPQKQSGDNVAINTTFKEPIFKILPQIKNKPYFVWPAKLGGDPASRESMPYCAYHREKGHLTESCRNYKALLEELVRDGHLHQFVDSAKHQQQRVHVLKPKAPIGTIEVIHSHARADNLRTETRAAAHLREIFQVSEGVTPAPKRLRKEMTEEIIFTDRDLEGVQLPHSDALVVTMQIGDFEVKRILIDPGSSAEIMYDSLFKGLGLEHKDLDRKVDPLYGFSGESVMPVGRVTVKVHAGTISSPTEFWVLNSYSPYNAILGRPWLHKMKAVPSTLHQRLRFLTPEGIIELQERTENEGLTPQKKCAEELIKHYMLDSDQERYFLLGASFSHELRGGLTTLLMEYTDVFAWNPYEAPGVDPAFACHSLNVDPLIRPVVQKGRRISPFHQETVCEEVNRLVEARAIREILYPTWLSNTVVVKKKNGKWRVCIDFTDLNKACPKDPFPLPKIDQLVDATSGHQRMSFLDAFQGYHQIAMNLVDEEKTAFITPRGIFCYKVMPFGLKNAGDTYQRMITKMFSSQLGKTVEVYIDDMVVKSVYAEDHLGDLSGRVQHVKKAPSQVKRIKMCCWCWVREILGVYGYPTRTSIKGQVLADFIAEFTPTEMGPMWVNHVSSIQHMEGWKLYIDGASNSRGSGLGVVLTAPQGQMMELAIRLGFPASNNVAEYEALLHGLRCAITLQVDPLIIYCDSQLVVNQISGSYAAKDKKMKIYLIEAKRLLKKFKHVQVEHIGRDLNGHADALASLASAVAPKLRRIISVGMQSLPSIGGDIINEVCSVEQSISWMSPILAYLKDDTLPANRREADRIRRVAPRYWVSKEGNLYRRSYTGPYLRCVHPDTVQNLLWEIHEGVCGGHTGGRSLAHRGIGQGYWWPYMQKDAAQYVKKCDKCQRFAPSIHQPAASLNPITSPWPFSQWGLDIVGPLPRAPGNRQWLIVATDYFTKWVEVEPLVHITDADSKKFVWKNIITRFGIPRVLVSDNGSQFTSGPFREFCEQYGIRNHFSTPAYPQGNGQAESSNKTLLDGIKKHLEKAKGRWVEELPNILWTYRTTPRCSTGETPFSLTYGVEAVIPLEIGLPTIRTEYYDPVTNETSLATDLDLAEEKRDSALIHLAAYQNGL